MALFQLIFVQPMVVVVDFLTENMGPVGAIITIAGIVNALIFALSYRDSVKTAAARMKFAPYRRRYKAEEQTKMYQDMQKVYQHYNAHAWRSIIFEVFQFPVFIALYRAINYSNAIKTSSFFGVSLSMPMANGIALKNPICISIFVGMLILRVFAMIAPTIYNKKPLIRSITPSWFVRFLTTFLFGISLPVFVSIYYAVFTVVSTYKGWCISEGAKKLLNNDTWKLSSLSVSKVE